jgi:hypothetical protein
MVKVFSIEKRDRVLGRSVLENLTQTKTAFDLLAEP